MEFWILDFGFWIGRKANLFSLTSNIVDFYELDRRRKSKI
jgi:hypothetical protein